MPKSITQAPAVRVQHDILRLQVAVDESLAVGGFQCTANLQN
jgi:hypothetical protein